MFTNHFYMYFAKKSFLSLSYPSFIQSVILIILICIFFIFIYLFWLYRVLVVAHGIFIAACRIFRCRDRALCCSAQASLQLWCVGSRVHGLCSCLTWAQLPHSMWDPSSPNRDRTCVPYIRRQFLTTGPPGKSLIRTFFKLSQQLKNPI